MSDPTDEKRGKKGSPSIADKFEYIEECLQYDYVFRYNEIKGTVEWRIKDGKHRFEAIDDFKLNSIQRDLRKCDINVSTDTIDKILKSEFTPVVNPIREFLTAKSVPRTEKNINELASTVKCVNMENWSLYLKKWLVSCVANVTENVGCQNHTCLVLTGDQGKFKTTWLDNLMPKELLNYLYTGKIDPSNKDSLTQLSQCFLINIDDQLKNLNQKDENALKSLITQPKVLYRKPYDRYWKDVPRIASFMGSVNGNDFLTDPTGSRRFLPFEIESIDINKAKKVNMANVWREAYNIYKTDFQYWFSDDELNSLYEHNSSFQVHSLEYELVTEYFQCPATRGEATHFYTSSKIKALIEEYTRQKLRAKPLGEALHRLGFERWQRTKDRVTKWVWGVIVREGSEIVEESVNRDRDLLTEMFEGRKKMAKKAPHLFTDKEHEKLNTQTIKEYANDI